MNNAARSVLAFLTLLVLASAVKAQGVSSSGTDYWLGFMPNGAPWVYAGYDQTHLFIASSVDNQVQVAFAGEVRKYNIPASTVLDVVLPDPATTRALEVPVNNGAVHVTSVSPITIYGYSVWASPNTIGGSPDGYLGLPITSYGTKYITVNYYASQFGSASTSGEFLIVAPYDNTQVKITTKGDTRLGNSVSHRAGVPWTVSLMKGQTYLVQSDNSLAAENDLTGSLIESDKPISVLTGHEITPITIGDRTSADHLIEMIPPVDRWGTQYFDMPMAGRTGCGDYIRIISGEDGNQITYNGRGPFRLDAGEFAERDLVVDPEVYTSINNKKFVVMQYSYSQGYNGDPGTADPFMILMTAQQQFEKHMVFRTPTPAQSGTFNNYITFICVDSAIRKIKIDGKAITSYQYVGLQSFPATNPTMSAYRVKLPGGARAYFAEGPAPFGAYQYGFSNYEGYGWPTGMAQRLITPDTLAPLASMIDSSCGVYHVRYFEPRRKTNGYSFDDTRFAYLALITAIGDPRWPNPSSNFDFADSTFAIGDSVTIGTLRVLDLTKDGYAAVYATDLAGNDTVFEYHYYAPKMSVSPTPTYTFDDIIVDGDTCITVTIANEQADGDFKARSATIEGTAKGGTFSATPNALSNISVHSTEPITLCYHASDTGIVSYDTLIVNTECVTYRYPLIGSGATPLIYAQDLNFGEVDSGLSRCLPLKLTNRGTKDLVITKQDLASDPNFSVDASQQFPIIIPAGGSVTIQYCFHPQSWGSFDATVLFSNLNPARFQHSVKDTSHLSGISQPAGAKLTTYIKDFGLPSCTAKPIVQDTLYNDLPNDKEITDVKIIGPDAQFFKIIGNVPTYPVLLPGGGGSIPYEIQFDPMLNGLDFTPRVATLQVYTSDGKSQPAAKLNGVLTTPVVGLSTTALNVGSGKVGGQVTSTFSIVNSGNAPLTITSYTLTGADAGAFTLSPAPPFDVLPNAPQLVTVTVTGAEPRDYNASINLQSGCNATDLPMTAKFSKNGDAALGTVHPHTYVGGCRSDEQNASFTNLNSQDVITVSSVDIQALNGWNDIYDFSIQTPVTDQPVPASGGSISVPILFTPTVTGPRSAALVFHLLGKGSTGADSTWTEVVQVQGYGMFVERTFAVGSITPVPNYSQTPGKNFTASVVIDKPIESGAPDNGSSEAYGYRFSTSWDRDAVRLEGVDAPNSSITLTELGTPSFDPATNLESHLFQASSSTPITGITTVATIRFYSLLSKADSTPILLTSASWLDKNMIQLCYVADTTLNNGFNLQAECGTATLQAFLKDRSLTGLLGNVTPNPVTEPSAAVDYVVGTSTNITVEIRNVMGDLVRTVMGGQAASAGAHRLTFSTEGLSSGNYYLRMTDGRAVSTKQFTVNR
jgi:hypothetical protein